MPDQLDLYAEAPASPEPAKWCPRGHNRWDLVEDGVIIGTIRKQGDTNFEWLTRFAHRHAKSLEDAKRHVETEIER